jgi:hypothetical protein
MRTVKDFNKEYMYRCWRSEVESARKTGHRPLVIALTGLLCAAMTLGGIYITGTGNTGNIEHDKISKAEFTNTNGTPEVKKTRITAEKIVVGELPESEKDREFGFSLTVNGDEPIHFALKAGEKKTFELNSGSLTEQLLGLADEIDALLYENSDINESAALRKLERLAALEKNTHAALSCLTQMQNEIVHLYLNHRQP